MLTDFQHSLTGTLSSKVAVKQPLKILPEILLRCVISGAWCDYQSPSGFVAYRRPPWMQLRRRPCRDHWCLIMRHETSAYYKRSQNPFS